MDSELVKAAASKSEIDAILGIANDQERLSQGQDDWLPYDVAFDCVFDLQELQVAVNYDSKGTFLRMVCLEAPANDPQMPQVNRRYSLAFFSVHPTLKPYVLAQHAVLLREFGKALARAGGVPEAELNDPKWDPLPILRQLHIEVEPLGIRLRVRNNYVRTTRNNKKIHEYSFEVLA